MSWGRGQNLQGGKYTIEKTLGEGGFGITYLARQNNSQLVVIKTLNNDVRRRPDFTKFQQDFLNEALRLAKCSHPHIVQIYEVFQEGLLWCMAMEYINGEDLASYLSNRGTLPEVEALRYIQQIGDALTTVHRQGLLHRDIKPHNIMVRYGTSNAVLIDFGIAREFTVNQTQTHTQFLSNGYAPIEQYDRRAKRGAYTDTYALAATLYSILTGEVPVDSQIRAYNILKYNKDPLNAPQSINPKISKTINNIILKGMDVDPEKRPQTLDEWLAPLRNLSSNHINSFPTISSVYSSHSAVGSTAHFQRSASTNSSRYTGILWLGGALLGQLISSSNLWGSVRAFAIKWPDPFYGTLVVFILVVCGSISRPLRNKVLFLMTALTILIYIALGGFDLSSRFAIEVTLNWLIFTLLAGFFTFVSGCKLSNTLLNRWQVFLALSLLSILMTCLGMVLPTRT